MSMSAPRIFIYTGGRAPFVSFVVVDQSVTSISASAFERNHNLLGVHIHHYVDTIETHAFCLCASLTIMLMLGVKNVEYSAFYACFGLSSVEFGRDLETIGESAFDQCNSLRNIIMPNVLRIGLRAFQDCAVTELDLPLGLEVVEGQAFGGCQSLTRVSIPLKGGMIQGGAFVGCSRLVRIDLIGGIHDFVSSLHLEEWRNTMKAEINRINEDLPLINVGEVDKTRVIQEWMQSVLDSAEHYKGEHYALLKEGMTILELAVWGAKIVEAEKEKDGNDDDKSTATTSSVSLEENLSEKLKIDNGGDDDNDNNVNNDGDGEWRRFRQQQRGKSLANVVIQNVIPYLMCTKLDHE